MSQFNLETVVATSGDLGLFAGEKMYSLIQRRGGGQKRVCNVPTGQAVLFNPFTFEVLAISDIATAKAIGFGIGVGPRGQNATEVRTIGLNAINLCDFKIEATAVAPNNGCNESREFFFDCIKCATTYTIAIELDDHLIRGRYEYNNFPKYLYSATAMCEDSCKDCDEPTADCGTLAREFKRKINEKRANPNDFGGQIMFQRFDNQDHRPFYAMQIFKNDFKFDLDVSILSNGVQALPAITKVRIGTVVTELENAVYSMDSTKTSLEQFEGLAVQIDELLGNNGDVYINRGSGAKDANLTLEISSSNEKIDIEVGGSYVSGNKTENEKTCGIRVYADPIDWECFCDLPPNISPPNTFYRRLDIYQVGEGWAHNGFESGKVCKSKRPQGMGLIWKHKEMLHTEAGGMGRDFRYSNTRVGNYGLPGVGSRVLNTTVDCNTMYCNYAMVYAAGKNRKYSGDPHVMFSQQAVILVPEDHNTTKTAIEGVLAAFSARGICSSAAVTCDAGVDVEATLDVTESTAAVVVGSTVSVPFTYDAGSTGETLVVTSTKAANATATISGTDIVITGVAAGSATIKIKSSEGSVEDSISVTVTAA